MFRSWGEACIKGRAVTLTGFDDHRCAEKPTSEAEAGDIASSLPFSQPNSTNDFLDYAYQGSRPVRRLTSGKVYLLPISFKRHCLMIGGSKPGPLASFL